MIPDKWKKLPLDHVAHVQTGLAKGKKDIKNARALPYLRVANVQDGYLDLSLIKSIEVEESNIDRYLLKPGDVLLTEGGDFDKLGRGAIWQGEIDACLHQNHIFVVRTKNDLLMSEFLSLLTGSAYGKAYFLKCSKQSTNLASINSTQLKEFPVLLPPLTEQRKIVEAVNAWDSAIEKTVRLIAAKGYQFSWLLNKLINEGSDNRDWRKVKLEDLAVIQKGQQLNVNDMVNTGKYYALNGGMEPSGFTNNWNTHENTITISEGGNSCGFVSFNIQKFWCGGHCYALNNVESDVEKKYLYYFLKSHEQLLMSLRVGSGLPNIQKKDLQKFPILFPSLSDQKKIAGILDNAQQEIDLLKKQLEAYRQQKRGLMQKLLTGQWRVKINS